MNASSRPSARVPARRIVIVALGGLGLILAVLAAMLAGVVHLIKGTTAYRASLDFVTHEPEVIAALGSPIEDGVFPTGGVDVKGAFGTARFSIHLSGARAAGWAHVVSHRAGGPWIIDDAKLELPGAVVQLTPGGNPP